MKITLHVDDATPEELATLLRAFAGVSAGVLPVSEGVPPEPYTEPVTVLEHGPQEEQEPVTHLTTNWPVSELDGLATVDAPPGPPDDGQPQEVEAASSQLNAQTSSQPSPPASPPAKDLPDCIDCGVGLSSKKAVRCLTCNGKYRREQNEAKRAAGQPLARGGVMPPTGPVIETNPGLVVPDRQASVRLASDLPNFCGQCDAKVLTYQELDGPERRCLNGHIQYPAGFVPIEMDEDKERRREPSHAGARL